MFIDIDDPRVQSLAKKRQSNLKTSLPFQKYIVHNGIELNLKHCFALSSTSTKTPIQVLFDDQLLFVVGHYIVLHNSLLSHEQAYIELEPGFSSVSKITSAVLPDKKALLAYCDNVAEINQDTYSTLQHKRFFSFPNQSKKEKKYVAKANDQPKDIIGKEEGNDDKSGLYRGRIAVVGFNQKEKHILTHVSNENFEIMQIELSDAKYCYVLCENNAKNQVIHVWNFEKDVLLLTIEMKQRARKFALNPVNKSQLVICAPQMLRYLEINLVNKIVKYNTPAIVSMMIEKTNEFIDLQFVRKTNVLVVISKSNSIFFIKDMKLCFAITNFDIQKNMETQKGIFYDRFDQRFNNPDDADEEDIPEQHIRNEFRFGQISDTLVPEEVKACSFRCGIMEAPLLEHLKSQKRFKKLAVTQKHIFVASKGGYLTVFMLDPTLISEPAHLMTGKLAEHIISVKQLVLNAQETVLTCVGKYPFQIKEKLLKVMDSIPIKAGSNAKTPREVEIENTEHDNPLGEKTGADKRLYDYNLKYDVFSIPLNGITEGNEIPLDRVFPHGVHDGALLLMSGCKSKSCFVSIADGKNVRIWSHTNEWTNEENFYLDEQPLCVDWHPLSLQLALGFATGLRLYIVRESKLLLAYHRGTNTTSVAKYNDAGNLLAASDAFNVLIIDTFRYDVIRELTGHSANLRSIKWSPQSDYLFSVCKANTLFVWGVTDLMQMDMDILLPINRYYQKDNQIIELEYDPILGVIVILMSNQVVSLSVKDMEILNVLPLTTNKTQKTIIPITFLLSISLNSMIIAFDGGYIRIYYWPLPPGKEEYYEVYIDSESNIAHMLLTQCDRFLIVGMDNGSIFCLEVTKFVEGMPKQWAKLNVEWEKACRLRNYHGIPGFSAMDETILTSYKRINNLDKKIEELHKGIYNEKARLLWRLEKKWDEYKKETKNFREKCAKELETQTTNAEAEQKERDDRLEKLRQDLIHVQTTSKLEQEKVENEHKKLMEMTVNCNHEFDADLKKQKHEMKLELENLLKEHKKTIYSVKNTQEEFILKAKSDIENLIKEFEDICTEREGIMKKQGEDHDNELQRVE